MTVRVTRFVIPIIVLTLLLASCQKFSVTGGPKPLIKKPLTTEASELFIPAKMNVVAIMPVRENWSGEYGRAPAKKDEISPVLAEQLTDRLIGAFDLQTSLKITNMNNPAQFKEFNQSVAQAQMPLFLKAKLLGEITGAQGVLCSVVNRYDVSDGSRFGAEKLASVSFKLWLVDTASGKPVWSATYEKSNEPLSDNLFQAPQKLVTKQVQYQTAAKLIDEGFQGAAIELEKLRNKAIY